jgi:hypothetical protein
LTQLPRLLSGVLAAGLVLGLLIPDTATPRPQEVRVRSQSSLSFGTFMVFGRGSRSISATGALSDNGIAPLEGGTPRPARFTIDYDRGNESRQPLEVTVELIMSAPSTMRFGGVDVQLSAFETDLPGHARIESGDPLTIRITDCRTRVCSRTFNVGGRLDVTRSFGGARVDVPITILARIVERDRVR